MRLQEKKTERFELRLTKKEMMLIKVGAMMIGRTPTKFVRMVIENALLQIENEMIKEGFDYENATRDINDIL